MAGLNRDILRLNSVLRLRRGQETQKAAGISHARIPAAALPEWLKAGTRCCYVSKTRGDTHSVKVQKIDDRHQTVTIFFEQNRQIWKKVPFSECTKTGDGTLRPVWKAPPQVATCAGPPAQASTSDSSSKAASGLAQVSQLVEDIPSSDEGKASPLPRKAALQSTRCSGPAAPSMLVPRAVALGSRRKATPAMGPTGLLRRPVGPGQPSAPQVVPAEVSDDEVVETEMVAIVGSTRRRTRSPRLPKPSL